MRNKALIYILATLKWMTYSLVIILILLYLIMRLSSVQSYIANRIADSLSAKAGVEIEIGAVDISNFVDIELKNFTAKDKHDSLFINSKHILIKIAPLDLFRNILLVKEIYIDSTSFSLIEYKGEKELNLMQIVNNFLDNPSSDTTSNLLEIKVENLSVKNSTFALDMQNMQHFDGMDYTHLFVDSINLEVNDFRIQHDSIIGNIVHFSVREKCGFRLDTLSGKILVSPREIYIPNLFINANSTKAYANFKLEYSQWNDWLDFINKVKFNTVLDSSSLYLDDMKYFSTTMEGMKDRISVKGKIKGSIENLRVSKTNLTFGKSSSFNGSLFMTGLPDFDQTFLRFKVKKAVITNADVIGFYLPGEQHITTNEKLDKLGKIIIKGRFTGFYYDFVSEAKFNTDIGEISTDISIQPESKNQRIRYSGKLNAKNFDLGKLLETSYVGRLNMQAQIDGLGLSKDSKANFKMDFQSFEITNYNYKKMSIIGDIADRKVSVKLSLSNEESTLSADGFYDYKDTLKHLFLFANIDNAEVNRFFLIDDDTLGRLSTSLNLNVFGDNLYNIKGKIVADSFSYSYNSFNWQADSILLKLDIDSNNTYSADFKSPFLDARISGFSQFDDFEKYADNISEDILPGIFGGDNSDIIVNEAQNNNVADKLVFDINISDVNDINLAFFPYIVIADNSKINGVYYYEVDSLLLNVKSSEIAYQAYELQNIDLIVKKSRKFTNYDVFVNYFESPDITLDSLNLLGYIQNDTIKYAIDWGATQTVNSGIIDGRFVVNDTGSYDIDIFSSQFYFRDTLWTLKPDARIKYHYHYFSVSDFELYHGDNNLLIGGLITDNPHDFLKFSFNQFDISLFDFYTKRWDTDIDGFVNGTMELSNIWKRPGFISNFVVSDFYFNNSSLNTLKLNALYSRTRKAIVFDITAISKNDLVKYIDAGGFYYPYVNSHQLDMEVRVNDFPLTSIQNYLSSFSRKISGTASGILKLKGNLSQPIVLGTLKTDIDDILIDYTKVHYKIHDKLIFTPDYFGFINAKAEDKDGDILNLTAKISHHYFNDLKFDIDIKPNSAELLNINASDNELFYGSAFGTGIFKLHGDANKMNMKMDITPVKKSIINIPISSQYEAEKSDFVSFVLPDSSAIITAQNVVDDDFNLDMDMMVNITPSTEIRLVMNATSGDVITAFGKGKLHMVYNTDGYNIYGKYIIDNGNYLFTMQNIINKRFIIESGSELNWEGDMETATINLKAIYHVDAKLWDLLQQLDSSEASVYKRQSKVDCIINITGKLFNPDISFDIKLPEESIATRELVKQVISPEATGNSEELNKNFVSLLVLGRFQAPSGYESGSNPNALSHNTYEMLAEQVGNLLNNMVDKVEIGVDWNPGDDITTQEVAVALTYKMLNDRLIIDGKFGTGGGSKEADASTRIVGDVNIEYKLTDDGRIRAKVFNRTNYYDPLTRRAPYTQGVGISFRKDFNNFSELFSSKKKEKEKAKIKRNKGEKSKKNME